MEEVWNIKEFAVGRVKIVPGVRRGVAGGMFEELETTFKWSPWGLEAKRDGWRLASRSSEIVRDGLRVLADEFEHRAKCPAIVGK